MKITNVLLGGEVVEGGMFHNSCMEAHVAEAVPALVLFIEGGPGAILMVVSFFLACGIAGYFRYGLKGAAGVTAVLLVIALTLNVYSSRAHSWAGHLAHLTYLTVVISLVIYALRAFMKRKYVVGWFVTIPTVVTLGMYGLRATAKWWYPIP